MSYFSTSVSGRDGITAKYWPAREGEYTSLPAGVVVELTDAKAYMLLDIADARSLLEQLPAILAEHDAAEAVSSSDRAA